eukprot:8952114-Pyramimonas_sp.AAC.1
MPSKECPPMVHWEAPQHAEFDEQLFSGDIFFDGSCRKRVIKELCRAGWGLAAYDNHRTLQCAMRAPLWDRFPQTSQAADCSSLACGS